MGGQRPGPWLIVGESLAGRPVPEPLRAGQAVVIATGGMVPPGADAVVRSEAGEIVERAGGPVVVATGVPDPAHVRPAGQECSSGEVLAAAGTVLGPALIGLAAAAGHDDLLVVPRPRAALVLFGDELATSGIPAPGFVRDSLGPQVPAWLARMGVEVVGVEQCADTLAAHVEAISRAARSADIVLTTGGTAAGPVDHLHAAIEACDGEVLVDSVAVRPGHPMLAGRVRSDDGSRTTWLVGLPGNPQSAIVTLVSLGSPIIARLSGRRAACADRGHVRGADRRAATRGPPCARLAGREGLPSRHAPGLRHAPRAGRCHGLRRAPPGRGARGSAGPLAPAAGLTGPSFACSIVLRSSARASI